METVIVEIMEWLSMSELVTHDGIISVIPEETGLVDMAELGCPPTWVFSGIVVCASAEISIGDVFISSTLEEKVVDGTLEVSFFPG